MASRAAATCWAFPLYGAAVCPFPALVPAAAGAVAWSRPSAGLPQVPGLARPAVDLLVTVPDAAQTLAPCVLPAATCRVPHAACHGERSAPGVPVGTGLPARALRACRDWTVRGIALTGLVGRSVVSVHADNDILSTQGVLR